MHLRTGCLDEEDTLDTCLECCCDNILYHIEDKYSSQCYCKIQDDNPSRGYC